jgi:rfaE bifunctional protein kinase chain/domain
VDWVYIEERPTAAEVLAEVQPDVYVKGREYEYNSDPRFQAERKAVESRGGRVVFSSGDVVFSSTALISALEQSIDPFQARLSQLAEREELQGSALTGLLGAFRSNRILIVGETILDTYVLCDRPDVAGESPVMTLRPIERRHYDGGAAIIARNIAAMGGKPVLITPLPRTEQGESIRRRLVAEGVEVYPFHVEQALTEKQRFLVGAQKVMKLDLLEPLVLDASQQERLVDMAVEAAGISGGCQGAIIADFAQGLFSNSTLDRLCSALRAKVPVLAGDVSGRRANLRAMHSMDVLCPSESEVREAFGQFDTGLPTVAYRLLEETRSKAAIITMGAEGLIAFDRIPGAAASEDAFASRVRGEHVPAFAPFAIDALGCGDSLLSAVTLALASGSSLVAGAFVGSVAAAVQAQRIGNLPVSATDLRHGIMRVQNAHLAYAAPDVIHSRRAAVVGA